MQFKESPDTKVLKVITLELDEFFFFFMFVSWFCFVLFIICCFQDEATFMVNPWANDQAIRFRSISLIINTINPNHTIGYVLFQCCTGLWIWFVLIIAHTNEKAVINLAGNLYRKIIPASFMAYMPSTFLFLFCQNLKSTLYASTTLTSRPLVEFLSVSSLSPCSL